MIDTAIEPHPYVDLEAKAIWRKAVGDVHPMHLEGLYRKKFSIPPEARISTAGSCFAQHISRTLKRSGFRFQDFEPAPSLFPPALAQAYNYGVYSARYCNIYTARQLHQTFERAMGGFTPSEEPWARADGVADPFRPLLEPEPFTSVAEMERARLSHLSALRDMFHQTDVFIFTLGLTEAWVSRRDGAVLPLCPGTVAGAFREDDYAFMNFNYFEIFEDLVAVMGKMRNLNPEMRFVLTVSPVPLTATKSGDHVLAATLYSKSVLRAVAGHLAKELDFVDYFPSYEIIAAAPMRGMFYDPNMRTVSSAGVDHVMSHFLGEHLQASGEGNQAMPMTKEQLLGDLETVCEEMMQAQEAGYA